MLKILGRATSINVRKVLWTADELGLSYEREDWGLPLRDPHAPEFLALNPNAQVPVLVDEDFVLWESNAIIAYLAEKPGGIGLLPPDPQRRALVMQWLTWQATELNPAWSYAVYALLRKVPGYDDPERIAQSLERWDAKMAILERQLAATGAYVAGGEFTLADIALGLSVRRWMAVPRAHPDLPAVRRYHDALRSRRAAAQWIGEDYV